MIACLAQGIDDEFADQGVILDEKYAHCWLLKCCLRHQTLERRDGSVVPALMGACRRPEPLLRNGGFQIGDRLNPLVLEAQVPFLVHQQVPDLTKRLLGSFGSKHSIKPVDQMGLFEIKQTLG